MSKKTQKEGLRSVKDVAEFKENDAARTLAELLQKKLSSEARLQELISYQNDYENQSGSDMTKSVPVTHLRSGKIFLEKLQQAITEQRQVVERCSNDAEALIKHWQKARGYSKALDKLIEYHHRQEANLREKRQQRDADERAQRSDINPFGLKRVDTSEHS